MRNRNEFVQLIDRYRLGQAQRLSIGATLSSDFRSMRSALILAEGRGKFLRVRWIENREMPLPGSIADACQKALSNEHQGLREFAQLRVDLTRTMATGINQLAMVSGVHSKMLMVVCVDEPGIWVQDYDGRPVWQPFCEPEPLAESTGLTVVDSLPSRDLATGGRGWPITPLANWLMFADRNQTIADQSRLLVNLAEYTELTWLPESDGLDDELPAIRFQRVLGSDFERRIVAACGQTDVTDRRRDDVGAQGKVSNELSSLWNDFVSQHDLTRKTPVAEVDQLVQRSLQVMQSHSLTLADALMTLASHIALASKGFVSRQSSRRTVQLVAGGGLATHGLISSELNQLLETTWLNGQAINYDATFLPAVTAAVFGLMHVDQMPMTIPWISGSEIPRVLGRLTPGSPANWRRVIMEMGDCRPPVMRLRDAV